MKRTWASSETYSMEYGKLLLDTKIHIAILVKTLLDDLALILTALADGFHP